jgi:hypothetical protein
MYYTVLAEMKTFQASSRALACVFPDAETALRTTMTKVDWKALS